MVTTPLTKKQVKAIAKEMGVKMVYWNSSSSAFKVEGAHSALARFRSTVSQDLGGIAYTVTDDGSYPWYAVRLYTPMQ